MQTTVIALMLIAVSMPTIAQPSINPGLARDLHRHNLNAKAKEAFIFILHDSQSQPDERADVLYWLGQIAFEEKNYHTAFEDWRTLSERYPQSPQAQEIVRRFERLQAIIQQLSDAKISSAVAQSYIENGDYWSKGESKKFIDSSYLPRIVMAVEWYDKVIAEFPDSKAAEIAYRKRIFALLGWDKTSQYDDDHGALKNLNHFMPIALETFSAMQAIFPEVPIYSNSDFILRKPIGEKIRIKKLGMAAGKSHRERWRRTDLF